MGVEEKQMELANLEKKFNDLKEELDKDQLKLKSDKTESAELGNQINYQFHTLIGIWYIKSPC